MIRTAPAKINLGLHVLKKRADGFHDIETAMIAIEWFDRIRVFPSDGLMFASSDPELAGENNLCMRAAELLREFSDSPHGAAIELEKHIPHGAGLGGGSSDAATTLVMLNETWKLGLTGSDLSALGARIGSDVPFFVESRPAMAEGRGERLAPLQLDGAPYTCPFEIVVALPNERVSTAEAYRAVRPQNVGRTNIRDAILSNDLDRWRAELVNDFEAPIMEMHPSIGALKESLYDAGAGYAAMSGSGSAVYGIFDDDAHALAAAEMVHDQGLIAWKGRPV